MSQQARKPRNKLTPERERGIITAAADVFIERGLGNATMDQIAEKAGVTKVTLYRRFDNKQELFERVIQELVTSMGEAMNDLHLDIHSPRESLRRAAQSIAVANTRPRHTELLRLLIAEAGRHPEAVFNARVRINGMLLPKITEFFETLIAEGKMVCDQPAHTARSFVIIFAKGFRPLFNAVGSETEENEVLENDLGMFIRGFSISAS